MEIVFDASTLILLAKIEILREISGEIKVIIPGKVKAECLSKEGIDAILISTLIKENKIEVRKTGNPEATKKIQRDFRIESGEAEAIFLAKILDSPLAVDDGPTIKATKVMGLKFTTAIHLLLNLFSQKKLELPIAIAKLEKLFHYGRYSKEILEDAMKRLRGEE
jgi:predicted nucleic acid-binding protein